MTSFEGKSLLQWVIIFSTSYFRFKFLFDNVSKNVLKKALISDLESFLLGFLAVEAGCEERKEKMEAENQIQKI